MHLRRRAPEAGCPAAVSPVTARSIRQVRPPPARLPHATRRVESVARRRRFHLSLVFMAIPRRDFCIRGKIGSMTHAALQLCRKMQHPCRYHRLRTVAAGFVMQTVVKTLLKCIVVTTCRGKLEEIGRNDDGLSLRMPSDLELYRTF